VGYRRRSKQDRSNDAEAIAEWINSSAIAFSHTAPKQLGPRELTSQRESRNRHRAALYGDFKNRIVAPAVEEGFSSDRFDRSWTHLTERFWRRLLTRHGTAVKGILPVDFESDEALEAILRRELIEIACLNGVSDPETIRDILLTRLPPVRPAP
jgi:hypothetical protein